MEQLLLSILVIIYIFVILFFMKINVWLGFLVSLIMAILMKIYYPKLRGYFGEFWVKRTLNQLPKNDYKIINNLTFATEDKTVQVDHLVISKYGIFVLEMKNYYGLILGNEYSEQWTQVLGRKKFSFYSPIRQNYGHIKSLESVLNVLESNFISIIVFSNQSRLKVKSLKTIVINLDYLSNEIKKYQEVVIDDNDSIYNKILSLNIKDRKVTKEHVKSIKENLNTEQELVDQMICPKCSSKLVERTSKRGPFIGCSNYPKCRFIKNI